MGVYGVDAPPKAAKRRPPSLDGADPAAAVAALYQDHAVSLIRLAHIMLGNRSGAEDVVQDAFCGLYRRWACRCSGQAGPGGRSWSTTPGRASAASASRPAAGTR